MLILAEKSLLLSNILFTCGYAREYSLANKGKRVKSLPAISLHLLSGIYGPPHLHRAAERTRCDEYSPPHRFGQRGLLGQDVAGLRRLVRTAPEPLQNG